LKGFVGKFRLDFVSCEDDGDVKAKQDEKQKIDEKPSDPSFFILRTVKDNNAIY
jgi:hypothetical protein